MAINVTCSQCSHEWTVPTAKAGRTVHCPECDETETVPRPAREDSDGKTRERLRPGHRPTTQKGTNDKTILLGATILLIGVLAIVGFRLRGILTDENIDSALSSMSSSGSETDTDGSAVTDSDTDAKPKQDEQTSSSPQTPRPFEFNEESRRQVLSELTDVTVQLDVFSADTRGAVSDAVQNAVSGAMERCQLTCADTTDTVMQITLELRADTDTQELWMDAKLTHVTDGQTVDLWSRSASVGTITDQAFTSAILPPGLDRDTSTFFTELRSDIVSARQEFQK